MVTGTMPVDQDSSAGPGRAELARELAAIFARLLDQPAVDQDTHFADLGGDSIQTLSLLLELESRFGLSLTPPQFAEHGSVAALVALIAAAKVHAERIALVQKGDGRAPVFLAHAVHGATPYAAWLASALGPARTVHALIWRRSDGSPTLESYASGHVAAIRAVQPHGPFRLIGHSFGAILAYEVARQLTAAGEHVGFLGLLDASGRLSARDVGSAVRPPAGRHAEAICRQMLNAYVPDAYPGNLWLCRAEVRNVEDLADETLGWRSLVRGRVHLLDGTGTHGGMMNQANVSRWGGRLREAIDAADASPPASARVASQLAGMAAWAARSGITAAAEARRAAKRGDARAEIAFYRDAIAAEAAQPWWVWRNLAGALEAEGYVEGALDALARAVEAEATPIRACWAMARTLQRAGRRQESRAWIDRARSHDRDDAPVQLALGEIAAALGQHREAERRFRRVVALCPVHDLAMVKLHRCLVRLGCVEEALDVAEQVARLRPRDVAALLDVAELAAGAGDRVRRDAALRAVLTIAPGHAEAARRLAT